jgi:hypothetical protein
MLVADDTGVLPSTACITNTCSSGSPMQTINTGVMCGGTTAMPLLCDAQGACGCMSNADCTLPQACGGGGTPLVCGCTQATYAA